MRVGFSCLAHKDPGLPVQLHGVRRALEADALWLRLAAVVEGHLVLKDRQREAGPEALHVGHLEAGGLVGPLRVRLGVEELDLLAARPLAPQLHAYVHQLLRPVGDGEEDGGVGRGRSDIEDEGEVAVEGVGHVGQRRLTRQGFAVETEADLTPQTQRPVDLGRGRVSDQLEQRDAAFSCQGEAEIRTSENLSRISEPAEPQQNLRKLQQNLRTNRTSAELQHNLSRSSESAEPQQNLRASRTSAAKFTFKL